MDLSSLSPTARLIVTALQRAYHRVYGPRSLAEVGELFRPGLAAGEAEATLNTIAGRVEPTRRRGYPDIRVALAAWVCENVRPLLVAPMSAVLTEFRLLLPQCLWD